MMRRSSKDNRENEWRELRRRRFDEEVTRLLDRLYGTALRLTRHPDDAEDVVAETIGKAWERLDDLQDWQCLEGWLFRILNNTFVSWWRRRRSRQGLETELNTTGEGGDEQEAEDFSLFRKLHQPFLLWWSTPEQEFVDRLLREDLEKALDALPDAFRIVVVLVEVQGYTYAEVASLLDIPLGTVRSRVNRGRALLQKALWEYAGETFNRGQRGVAGGEGEQP